MKQKVHFTVECHGVTLRSSNIQTTYVSSHWVRSCLEVHLTDLFAISIFQLFCWVFLVSLFFDIRLV